MNIDTKYKFTINPFVYNCIQNILYCALEQNIQALMTLNMTQLKGTWIHQTNKKNTHFEETKPMQKNNFRLCLGFHQLLEKKLIHSQNGMKKGKFDLIANSTDHCKPADIIPLDYTPHTEQTHRTNQLQWLKKWSKKFDLHSDKNDVFVFLFFFTTHWNEA